MTKVLVVDDDPVVRLLVNDFLSTQGYQVETIEHGSECANAVAQSSPDIVLLDLLMPDMNGLEVLKQLKSNPSTSSVPIVLMSSDFDTENLAQENQVNADLYVQKPFGMYEILKALKSVTVLK